MGQQKVNGVDLKQLEDRLEQKFDSITKQVKRLNESIDNLEGQWKGIGAGEFNRKQREVNEDITSLRNMLNGFKNSIHDTRTLSGNTEDEVRRRMQGISVEGGLASSGGPDTTQGSLASKLSQY
ncbi:WXG100 family type VII secretion target [Streptomyces sp. NPDC054796]|uniref:WXG100 family type VII secretion target n=1 Tax=Streptomyces daliensis TaxID=299421 RepID=A0A8T4IWE4_9ACTN|nr:WXG100 family type VII secretion target [Streptomyces daliensis]